MRPVAQVSECLFKTGEQQKCLCSELQVSLILLVQFYRTFLIEESDFLELPIRTKSEKINSSTNVKQFLANCFRIFEHRISDLCENGSNWIVLGFIDCKVLVGECKNLYGKAGIKSLIVRRPEEISNLNFFKIERGVNDSDCFFKCLALYFLGNKCTSRDYFNFLDESVNINVSDPVQVSSIKRFEKNNPQLKANINVFCMESESDLFPIYISPFNNQQKINLLLNYLKTESNEIVPHYMLIDDMNKFVRKRYKKYPTGYNYEKCEICLNCMTKFSKSGFENHVYNCRRKEPQIVCPPKQTFLSFRNFQKKSLRPIVGFYDFECVNMVTQFGTIIQKAVSFCIIFVDKFEKVLLQCTYTGTDAAEKFIDKLISFEERLAAFCSKQAVISWDQVSQVERDYFNTKNPICHICEQLIFNDQVKSKDHCCLTGKYLGPAHQDCQLNQGDDRRIALFAHNSTGYDLHLITKVLGKNERFWRMEILPKNSEKFIALYLNNYVFLDSMSFLPNSLNSLVDNLVASNYSMNILEQSGLYKNEVEKALLLKKGIYCYDFAKSYSQLKNTQMPGKDEFFSVLKDEDISDEDYAHAQKVYTTFKCKNMLEYTRLYNKLDVFLLAECMNNFRRMAHMEFKLDPLKYVSLPAFSYDAFLYRTKEKIRLMKDTEMLLMIESGIRGGLSFIAERYAKASPTMTDRQYNDLNEKEKEKICRILYLDFNNLYGSGLTSPMGVDEYNWLTKREIEKIDWTKTTVDSHIGYILECDLEYPPEIHWLHSSFPLAPFHKEITYSNLSEHAKYCFSLTGHGCKYKSKKLTSTFEKRVKYVIHYNNLREYIRLGLKLTYIHRVISFVQKPIVKDYVLHCTSMRQKAKNTNEKNLFKLMTNSLYGKSLESVRNRLNCHINSNVDLFKKRLSHPLFQNFKIINDKFVLSFSKKQKVYLSKHQIIGFTVLENSKLEMAKAYYDTILKLLGPHTRLMATDTDSFLLRTSAPSTSFCYKKKFKDETKGNDIIEYVGVRSKVYSLRTKNGTKNTCKGVRKSVKNKIPFKTFKKCIKRSTVVHVKQHVLRSKNQEIILEQMHRIAFSCSDDKRYMLDCSIHTLPYASKHIRSEKKSCTLCI